MDTSDCQYRNVLTIEIYLRLLLRCAHLSGSGLPPRLEDICGATHKY